MEKTTNSAALCGYLAQKPEFSHENHGRRFDRFLLEIPRLSGACDVLPVLAAEDVLDVPLGGGAIQITGQVRSFNSHALTGRKLILSVFADRIAITDEPPKNEIALIGTICKPPILHRTPLGREICDLMLCVVRQYHRTDYIPCIAWGRTAQELGALPAGSLIELKGRMQSRDYRKVLPDGSAEMRVAYEVSALSASPAETEEKDCIFDRAW